MPRVEISSQDGRMGYLSLILYLREGTSLKISLGAQPLFLTPNGTQDNCALLVVPPSSYALKGKQMNERENVNKMSKNLLQDKIYG